MSLPRAPWSQSDRVIGLLLATGGVLVLSPDILIIRSIGEGHWTILFWRGLLSGFSLAMVGFVLNRSRPRQVFSRWTLVIAGLQAAAIVLFVAAVRQAPAANVLVIWTASPLVAAALGAIAFHERLARRTWVAASLVLATIGFVFASSLSIGQAAGDLAAITGTLCSAATLTIIRHRPSILPFAALSMAGFLTAGIAAVLGPAIPDWPDAGLILFHGLLLLPTAIVLSTTALTRLPAPEVGLIMRLELVFGSLWVWAVLGEVPSRSVVLAGAAVLVIFTVHSWLSLHAGPSAEPAVIVARTP